MLTYFDGPSWQSGIKSCLPEDFNLEDTPEWRLVNFSLIFPLPQNIFPHDNKSAFDEFGFFLIDDKKKGDLIVSPDRYKGISVIDSPEKISSMGGGADAWRSKSNEASNAKRQSAAYRDVRPRFGVQLGSSVGFTDKQGEWPQKEEHFRRCTIGAENYTSLKTLYFRGDEKSGRYATLSLHSFEILQYSDFHALSTESDNENNCSSTSISRYLVMHIVAENCTNCQLEKISSALYRPRNKFYDLKDEKGTEVRRPLLNFTNVIRRSVEEITGTFIGIFMMSGCYVGLPKPEYSREKGEVKKYIPDEEKTAHGDTFVHKEYVKTVDSHQDFLASDLAAVEALAKQDNIPFVELPSAYRSVSAVSYKPITTGPRLFNSRENKQADFNRNEKTESRMNELVQKQWAWQLATGADRYWESQPDIELKSENLNFSVNKYWTVLAAESGIAHVKSSYLDDPDTQFWNLSSTRRVDLAILAMRSYSVLNVLIKRLAEVEHFGLSTNLEALTDKDSSSAVVDQEYKKIQKNMERFSEIQESLVYFRSRLWFNAVPKRPRDTEAMLWIRQATGVEAMYSDFLDEMKLRQEIYTVNYQRREVEQKRFAEEERLKAEEKEESERSDREDEHNRINLLIALGALILTIPAFTELWPYETSEQTKFWVTVIIVALLSIPALAWAFVSRRKKRKQGGKRPN